MPDSVLIPAPVRTTHGTGALHQLREPSSLIRGDSRVARWRASRSRPTVRVRFTDTDAQGIAHHSTFFVWLEVARVEYLREHAGGYQAIRDHGFEALDHESDGRYRAPACFDDVLTV